MTAQQSHPFLTDEQTSNAAIVARIIPASKEFAQPGVDYPEILNDILTSGAALRGRLARPWATLVDKAADAGQASIFRQSFPVETEFLETLTVQCYYRDARVMQALSIDVCPPFPHGYIQEPNDFSLLEPVRKRGEIYSKVP
jgi:hypothetical protein